MVGGKPRVLEYTYYLSFHFHGNFTEYMCVFVTVSVCLCACTAVCLCVRAHVCVSAGWVGRRMFILTHWSMKEVFFLCNVSPTRLIAARIQRAAGVVWSFQC